MLSTVVLCLIYGGLIAWLAMGPLLITVGYHYSPLLFGMFQALIFGAFILGNLLIKYAIDYFNINKIIYSGLMLTLLGSIFALIVSYYYSQLIILFIFGLMIFGSGAALLYAILQRVAIESSQEPMGLRIAIFSSCLGIAGVLSSAISSYIYDGSSTKLAYFLLVVALAASILNVMRSEHS
jgi:MFS family permease